MRVAAGVALGALGLAAVVASGHASGASLATLGFGEGSEAAYDKADSVRLNAAAQATLSFAHVQWVLCACAVALHAHTVAGIASLGGDDTPSPEMCLQLLLASLAATGELEGGAPNDQ